jgi:16S rRNA (adenine1518-N6/adenine1519-N6)-dimethyltransferase
MTSSICQTTILPTTRRGWQDLLNHVGIRPSKGMGQNFLFDRGVVKKIVDAAGINHDSTAVEIGPGLGIMTEELLARSGHVTVVELDTDLVSHLRRVFGDRGNFQVVEADALKIEIGRLMQSDQPYTLVANLPYSVASAITRHALEDAHPPDHLTIMVQREVADRMVASPPDMSILGVATQYYANARIAFVVPPDVFIPRPQVESAIVELIPRPDRLLAAGQQAVFFRLVNAGFRQKRKQVANSISHELGLPKDQVRRMLNEAEIDPSRRAETIAVEEWVRLTVVTGDAIPS